MGNVYNRLFLTSIITCFARVELHHLVLLTFDNNSYPWSPHHLHKLNDNPSDVSIIRRQWPWIASSEIMFVNYFWCNGFGRNHHDNVRDWIDLQRKQCTKEAKTIVCAAQNSPRTYIPMSIIEHFSGKTIIERDDNDPLSDPPAP